MAYYEDIDLFVTSDRNHADVINEPLEKIIENIKDTRRLIKDATDYLDTLEKTFADYTKTEDLNELLATGIKGDRGNGLEFEWLGTSLGVREEGTEDYEYTDLKGEKGDVNIEQLNELKTELENEIANIPKVTKTSELTNDSGFITVDDIPEVDLEPYALKTEIPTSLPANGGNSDTVDGKHAADFVQATNAFIGTQDFDTYESTKTWSGLAKETNAQNAPHQYSTVLNVGANNNSNFQLAHSYSNTSQFWVRGRHDVSGNYTPWAQVYTTENKPTASDIGALASNGTAVNASKVNNALTLQIAGATKNTFNGSSAQTFNIPNASTSAPGVMTTAQVTKLNGIETGATKNIVDTAMSSTSTNAVQNKVIYAYIQEQLKKAGDYMGKTMIRVPSTNIYPSYTYTNAKGGFADFMFWSDDPDYDSFDLIVDGTTIVTDGEPARLLKRCDNNDSYTFYELKIPFTSTFTVTHYGSGDDNSYIRGFIYVNN